MRGRKPTPTVLKLIAGNPGHRPISADEVRPEIVRCFDPPEYLGGPAQEVWRMKAPSFIRLGLLTEADIETFAAWCDAFAKWRMTLVELDRLIEINGVGAMMHKTKDGNIIQSPLVGICNKARLEVTRLGAEFGMTPSSRTRIDSDTGKRNEEW